MPKKNNTGGSGYKKRARKNNVQTVNNKFITRAEGNLQFYATIIKATGNRHFMVNLHDHEGKDLSTFKKSDNLFAKEFYGSLRGNIRKGQWVSPGDLVLVSLRDFNLNDNKIDIIKKYSYEEAKYLKKKCKIVINKGDNNNDEYISFENNEVVELPKKRIVNKSDQYMNDLFLPPNSDDEDNHELEDHDEKSDSVEVNSNEDEIDFDEI